MIDAFCSITAGILFQLTVFFTPQYLLNVHNKSTRNSSIASYSLFLIRGKVLVFDGSRVFLQTERYHLPLLLQSFGVKWRHLGSIRKCLFCIALSCPSTISSESVRMYWPFRENKSNIRRWTLYICWDQKPMFSVIFYQQLCWFFSIITNFLPVPTNTAKYSIIWKKYPPSGKYFWMNWYGQSLTL